MGTRVRFEPQGIEIEIKHAVSLLDAARRAGVSVRTRCGGKAGCLMCKVNVDGEERVLTPPSSPEQRKLGVVSTQGLRLACQVRVSGQEGLITVTVPEDPLKALVRRQLAERHNDDSLW
ncbi:2Fe-2S iron-sulfur cluster-binding protein [Paenibacillus apiarius]|uniref:(2Fe-2S)-binding protein n=1 Tax=Paenibacillus apiarius TaxID=46240 RepID=A0ABT4DS52_9BACL|nr:2Fe-2S iron-sulfur cluster-binding protein [Paenibacillus apiarius]MCY9517129.1 (2Fe-2S)-binding protein [Paenibacillus apiarius]MCY9520174.1 (2Fe-2S)-binding protein [Paenibacillus apiarius]MCY9554938.1 (2Fe-2S)-binding protein [Paenibacillus apiarius]MCY9561449.1 (2Fe-2S)-binding protein [Paenibacillus apiarius]MCY9685971.1 (2Fe-2S)-binding protein [Paenibacillus apiarius]